MSVLLPPPIFLKLEIYRTHTSGTFVLIIEHSASCLKYSLCWKWDHRCWCCLAKGTLKGMLLAWPHWHRCHRSCHRQYPRIGALWKWSLAFTPPHHVHVRDESSSNLFIAKKGMKELDFVHTVVLYLPQSWFSPFPCAFLPRVWCPQHQVWMHEFFSELGRLCPITCFFPVLFKYTNLFRKYKINECNCKEDSRTHLTACILGGICGAHQDHPGLWPAARGSFIGRWDVGSWCLCHSGKPSVWCDISSSSLNFFIHQVRCLSSFIAKDQASLN